MLLHNLKPTYWIWFVLFNWLYQNVIDFGMRLNFINVDLRIKMHVSHYWYQYISGQHIAKILLSNSLGGGGAIEVKFTHFQTILVFFKFKFLMSCFLKTGKGLLLILITNKFCNQLTLLWLLIASRISVHTVEICSITIVKPNSNSTVHLPIVTS